MRTDANFLRKTDAGHVAAFKDRVGAGCIMEAQEIAAVVRYIQSLEAKIAQLVLEKMDQAEARQPLTNAEAQVAAISNANSNPAAFTGRYGPDCGPGVPGCSDCEGGRCTMDCGGRKQPQTAFGKASVKIND